jgi:hypothetical protein
MDAGGRVIRQLDSSTDGSAAVRTWDIKDDTGHEVAAGLYFVLARSSAARFTTPVLVLD